MYIVSSKMNNNEWTDSEDEDYDDEYKPNDAAPPDVDDEFRKKVLTAKRSLYKNIVLAPELGTKNAQNNQLLNDYVAKLNKIYILALNAKSGRFVEGELATFPSGARDSIKDMIDCIITYFKKNNVPDTIPYEHYIRRMLHEYQFDQNG